jgi:hypothetical protein
MTCHRITSANANTREGDCSVCGKVKVYARKSGGWICAQKVYQSNKLWKKNNPEKLRESERRYAAKHPELRKAASQRWRERHPDKARERCQRYRENNRAKVRSDHWGRRGILSPDTGSALTQQEFDSCFERQGFRCGICSNHTTPHQRWSADHDHNTGLFRGVLCHSCNIALGYYEKMEAAPGKGLSVFLQQYLDAHRGRRELSSEPATATFQETLVDNQ